MHEQNQPAYGPYQHHPTPPPAAPGPPVKVKSKLTAPVWLIAVVASVIGLCCIGGGIAVVATDNPSDEPVAEATDNGVFDRDSEQRGEPAAEPAPAAPEPDGTTSGSCDMLLWSGPNEESEFAASVDVTNTGNVGIVVKVTVAFDQLGQDDYELTDEVKVAVGEVEQVSLSEYIDNATVDRHQKGGYDCRIDGELVDTFGDVE